MGKMEIVDSTFDPGSRYNLWSGLIAGLFLFLSYFGTDQSQVQRYLSGKNQREMKTRIDFQWTFQDPHAINDSLCRSHGFRILPIQFSTTLFQFL